MTVSPCIRILDEETVNKIAAGEVIERPASVVKELVENSVDAGSTYITIEITSDKTGVLSLKVTDNGCGMSSVDALMAFLPHATSKISSAKEIETVRSMGFRGEALASIAAVSDVTMITKPHDPGIIAGTKVRIRGGGEHEAAEAAAVAGTMILVEDLFFNTPARKKFLKSVSNELRHIYRVVETAAIVNNDIKFRLLQNGRERLNTAGNGSLFDAILMIYGRETSDFLLPVQKKLDHVSISGYISKPELVKSTQSDMIISVNRRAVKSQVINRAVILGYRTLIPKSRFPVVFIEISTDAGNVDVNVHPSKREIRLSYLDDIIQEIKMAIWSTLMKHDLIPGKDPGAGLIFSKKEYPRTDEIKREFRQHHMALTENAGVFESGRFYISGTTPAGFSITDRQLRLTEMRTDDSKTANALPALRIIGQYALTYIIATSEDEGRLYLIDQHAAHERILYEQVERTRKQGNLSQELITPHVLRLKPADYSILKDSLHFLTEEGFKIEDFGKNTLAVTAIPVVLGRLQDSSFIQDLMEEYIGGLKDDRSGKKERITCIVACRGAIKAGTALSFDQMHRLIEQLRYTSVPYTCPHGRPVIVSFDKNRIDEMFIRT